MILLALPGGTLPWVILFALVGIVILAGPLVVAIEGPILAARLIDGIDASNAARFRVTRRILYPVLAICYAAFLVLTWRHVHFAEWLYIGPLFLAPYVYLVAAPPLRRQSRSE